MASPEIRGTGGFFQVKENDWDEVNRAFRYFCNSIDSLTGRRGSTVLLSDLDLNHHRAINAEDPIRATDLVTRQYADQHYVARSTSLNPGISQGETPGSGIVPFATHPITNRLARWDNVIRLGTARIVDDDTYIIVGTGTTDAAVTANALVVGSSDNAGDLIIVRTGTNSEALRLGALSTETFIASERTGAGTYRDLVIYTNNGEAARFATNFNFTVEANLRWKSGTSFVGTLDHAIGADRTWTFPDDTGVVVLRELAQTLTNKQIGDPSDNSKTIAFTLSGATASRTLTLISAHTDNRSITFPNASDTLVGRDTTDTMTNKTLTSPTINGTVATTGLTMPSFSAGNITASAFNWSGAQTYTITNVTTDRAYDANSTSVDELADTLGTLIDDLRSAGLVL